MTRKAIIYDLMYRNAPHIGLKPVTCWDLWPWSSKTLAHKLNFKNVTHPIEVSGTLACLQLSTWIISSLEYSQNAQHRTGSGPLWGKKAKYLPPLTECKVSKSYLWDMFRKLVSQSDSCPVLSNLFQVTCFIFKMKLLQLALATPQFCRHLPKPSN